MITFEKELTSPQNITSYFHAIKEAKIGPDFNAFTVFIDSWINRQSWLVGTNPVDHWVVRVEFSDVSTNLADLIVGKIVESEYFKDAIISNSMASIEDEQLDLKAKLKRNTLLNESDWIVVKSVEANNPVPNEWIQYRQALRDITTQPGYPKNIVWPQKPTV